MNIFVILRRTIHNSLKLVVNDIQTMCQRPKENCITIGSHHKSRDTHSNQKLCETTRDYMEEVENYKHVAHESCFVCAWGPLLSQYTPTFLGWGSLFTQAENGNKQTILGIKISCN
jgi:hypothetical protein